MLERHGYMLIGLMLNVVLLGVMVTQLYIYYTTYKRSVKFPFNECKVLKISCIETAFG
jgi:hypothetical protein